MPTKNEYRNINKRNIIELIQQFSTRLWLNKYTFSQTIKLQL